MGEVIRGEKRLVRKESVRESERELQFDCISIFEKCVGEKQTKRASAKRVRAW